MSLEQGKASIRWLANEYQELNGTHLDILEKPPSALHFSRLAHISRPVVIKGFRIPALTLWSNEYLIERMGSRKISIAVTPNGRADAVTRGSDNRLYFVEPLIEEMTMAGFISTILTGSSDVYYLQSQNGNMYSSQHFQDSSINSFSEFEPLRQDVPSDIRWCSEAFNKPPDAVNLWIGDSKSVTSIHNDGQDPYENIYTVIRGTKYFTLLPPTEGWCLKECTYPHATYIRSSPSSDLMLKPSSSTVPPVRWSSVYDPHLPGILPPEAHPLHIELNPGDTLYLPAGWWHHVRQSKDITVALNWWYDMEMRGMSWVLLSFLRGVGEAPSGNMEEQVEDSSKLPAPHDDRR